VAGRGQTVQKEGGQSMDPLRSQAKSSLTTNQLRMDVEATADIAGKE